jgi:hypothetical protein
MQRLEVGGAVRHIYVIRRLKVNYIDMMKWLIYLQNLIKCIPVEHSSIIHHQDMLHDRVT